MGKAGLPYTIATNRQFQVEIINCGIPVLVPGSHLVRGNSNFQHQQRRPVAAKKSSCTHNRRSSLPNQEVWHSASRVPG
jgi:hypothetical protein